MLVDTLVNDIYAKSTFQKKSLSKFLASQDDSYFNEFEEFLVGYHNFLESIGLDLGAAIDAYLEMCSMMMKSRIKFNRTGVYNDLKKEQILESVYQDNKRMLGYMIGLALSQYLWKSHQCIFNHLKVALAENRYTTKKYLEVGPGHGLFLKTAVDTFPKECEFLAIDISAQSLNLSKAILKYFRPEQNIGYINGDVLDMDIDGECDFILMGEVLEHVSQPQKLLTKINSLLSQSGKAFISTCANSPAVDHIYHFTSTSHIQEMLEQCGFNIESETISTADDLPMDEIVRRQLTINYSALISVKK